MIPLYRLFALACGLLSVLAVRAAEYPPTPGTDRESAAYLDAVESYLEKFDLADPTLVFDRLGGTTATNWSVSKDGRVVGDLKCTSGNTNHHGAVIAYRLGRELDFNIYPVAVYKNVDRVIDGKSVREQCALKEWAAVFTQYYWARDTFTTTDSADKQALIEALNCAEPQPESTATFRFDARSAYGNPGLPGVKRVHYRGDTSLVAAAEDFSNMMVIDTLIGNEDRFPGGNMFFRSVTTAYQPGNAVLTFDDARVFSLDNEAAFKSRGPESTHSATDLKAHVSRFDPAMLERLETLDGDAERLSRIADDDERLVAFLRDGIRIVAEQYGRSIARCGRDAATF